MFTTEVDGVLIYPDPRIRVGVPLIGLPPTSLKACMSSRAERLGLKAGPPLFPPSLSHLLTSSRPSGSYLGKRILSIHGADDTLVPYAMGQEDIRQIEEEVRVAGGGGKVLVKVIEGQGHVVTPDMVKMTAEFIWANCLTQQSHL